jgi:hypothetical protein
MASNMSTEGEGTTFDLLVGYDTLSTTLEGIVPVVFDTVITLDADRSLEILGRIVRSEQDPNVILEGVAIRQ